MEENPLLSTVSIPDKPILLHHTWSKSFISLYLKTAKIMGITTELDFKLLMVSQLTKIPKSMYPNSRLLKETTTLTNK